MDNPTAKQMDRIEAHLAEIAANTAAVALTERDRKVIRFALARFSTQALDRATAAAEKTSNLPNEAMEAFFRDAKDAERLCAVFATNTAKEST